MRKIFCDLCEKEITTKNDLVVSLFLIIFLSNYPINRFTGTSFAIVGLIIGLYLIFVPENFFSPLFVIIFFTSFS